MKSLLLFIIYLVFSCSGIQASSKSHRSKNEIKIAGIELRTSVRIGIFDNQKPRIINYGQHDVTSYPSFISFTDDNTFVGNRAVFEQVKNPERTVSEITRFVGREFQDKAVQDLIKRVKYQLVNKDNMPHVKITQKEQTKLYSSEELLSILLNYGLENCRQWLGYKAQSVVFTVPADFGLERVDPFVKAANQLNLITLDIIDVPTAATIAYGLDDLKVNTNVLVFDFGADDLQVTVIKKAAQGYERIITKINSKISGKDIDDRILKLFLRKIKEEHNKELSPGKKNFDRFTSADEHAYAEVQRQSTQAKKDLQNPDRSETWIVVNGAGFNFVYEFKRQELEQITNDYPKAVTSTLDEVLRDSNLSKKDIAHVVLSGGSSNNLFVKDPIKSYFPNSTIYDRILPEHVPAYGATIWASRLPASSRFISKKPISQIQKNRLKKKFKK